MLVVVSDTHGRESHRLEGRTLEAVREADLVCHCGDLLSETALDAFEREATEFAAVAGNNDERAVRDRLPDTLVVEHGGFRIALAHGHQHAETHLSLFGRQSSADLVCVGHSHAPAYRLAGEVPILNPGSHAEPRVHRPAHAELYPDAELLAGSLVEPDGSVVERFEVTK